MQCKVIKYSVILFLCLFGSFFPLYMKNNVLNKTQKKAIVIGGTSGIGEALVRELCSRNYIVGFTGRRVHFLHSLQQEISIKTYIREMDVAHYDAAQTILKDLINEMDGVDIIIINAGIGNTSLEWQDQKEVIEVNVIGFAAIASVATDYFMKKNAGHIVGISSIAALRGSAKAPTYSASKAFVSNYLQGLRARFKEINKNIDVTTIEPGLIDTAMTEDIDFWKSTTQATAVQICNAIEKKSQHAYVTWEWRLVAWLFKILPDIVLYNVT